MADDLTASGDWMNRYRAGAATADEQRLLVEHVKRLEADLDDYRTIVREVAKVYDNLTSGAVSYPDTLASAVIAEHDERCYFRAERDAALARIAELEAERRAVIDCVNLYGDEIVHDALTAAGLLLPARAAPDRGDER